MNRNGTEQTRLTRNQADDLDPAWSPGGGKTHVARILQKLRLRDRVQVVIYAYESGLLSPGTT